MRTLRLFLAGTVILALLVGLGGAVVAQGEEEHSTSGTWLSLVEDRCAVLSSYNRTDQPSGDYQVRDLGVRCRALGTDPRLGEYMTYELNEDCFADGGCINWGPISQQGPDGSWSGWFAGTEDPHADTYQIIVMTGAGGYEGLTHIRHATGPFDALDHAGVIYEGDPPPMVAITDPILAVVAGRDAVAGYRVAPVPRFVSAAEVGPDVITDLAEVKGRRAAVDIPAGTPITPDLLEPAE